MKLLQLLRNFKKSFLAYKPLIEIFISRKNLLHNLNAYRRKYPNLSFAPVLKSNAYGHGLVQVAKILEKERTPFFVVDSLYEAMMLREEGICSAILVVGYTPAENIAASRFQNVAFTVTSIEHVKEISARLAHGRRMTPGARTISIHIKIDTGMHRQGILPEELPEAMAVVREHRNSAPGRIIVEGACSHLADADNNNDAFTRGQITIWNNAVAAMKKEFPDIKYFHLVATSGVFYSGGVRGDAHSNVARLGIGLYGVDPSPRVSLDLKPTLTMQSLIGSVKAIAVGESVGYGVTYKAARPTKIATVPAGYFEGIDLRLSNKGFFKINGRFCPIVGRVSMNITCVDVTDAGAPKLGDPVTIISNERADKNSVENIAEIAGTIPYEIFVHMPSHLRRTVV